MDLGFRHKQWPPLPHLKQGPGGFLSLLVDGGFEPCNAVLCLVTQSCLTLYNLMDSSPPGSSDPWDSPGKNTGEGCHALLQGIFPTLGLNTVLLHCRQILYQLSHQGSPGPCRVLAERWYLA